MSAVRSMDKLGAADVAVGQSWLHEVTQADERLTWQVVDVDRDTGGVVLARGSARCAVSVGALLSLWLLVEEAAA